MRKTVLSVCLCALTVTPSYAENADKETKAVSTPALHGVIRSRWEAETSSGYNRFEIRNARISLGGSITPEIDYLVQTDFCDQGKIKILDAWGRIKVCDGLSFRAGQFLMPVSVEALRAPADFIFANCAFMGKELCNARGVGAELTYTLPNTPLTLKAATFNASGIADHDAWNRTVSCSGSADYRLGNVTLCAGMQSTRPNAARLNILDGSITWDCGHLLMEAEYMNKHYSHSAYKSCHAWSAFADYRMPVNAGVFNRLSFQGRFDGMTDHSTGTPGADGTLITNHPARNRATIGSTISHIAGPVHTDIRLNYEKYFYHNGTVASIGDDDKVVAEFIIKF